MIQKDLLAPFNRFRIARIEDYQLLSAGERGERLGLGRR
jgi:hypothetical protein